MIRFRALSSALAALFLATGCAAVTSTQNSDARASGELWYVKQTNLFGLIVSSSVWHCPPPTKGAATCVEAEMVYNGNAPTESSEPAAAQPVSQEDPPIWRVATRSVDLAAACMEVRSLLNKDEECAGEQCRAPLELVKLFIVRCREQPSTDFAAAVKVRDLWRDRVEGDGGTCFATLRKAIREPEAAEEYTSKCLKGREPGKVEKAILDGKGQQQKKKKVTTEE